MHSLGLCINHDENNWTLHGMEFAWFSFFKPVLLCVLLYVRWFQLCYRYMGIFEISQNMLNLAAFMFLFQVRNIYLVKWGYTISLLILISIVKLFTTFIMKPDIILFNWTFSLIKKSLINSEYFWLCISYSKGLWS